MARVSGLFVVEFRRAIIMWWSYRLDAITWIVMWAVGFPLFMMVFDNVSGAYGPDQQRLSLIGFLVWNLSMGMLSATTQDISTEASEGTLENVVLNPSSLLAVVIARMVAFFVRHFTQTLVLAAILMLMLRLSLPLSGLALVIALLIVLGVGGLGLAFDGLALVYKGTAPLVRVSSLLLIVVSGALVPLSSLGKLFIVMTYLIPTAWGIDALREIIQNGATATLLWSDGTLVGLSVQTFIYLGSGLLVFQWGLRKARLQGSLGTY